MTIPFNVHGATAIVGPMGQPVKWLHFRQQAVLDLSFETLDKPWRMCHDEWVSWRRRRKPPQKVSTKGGPLSCPFAHSFAAQVLF